jgi:hypothetical protein
MTKTLTTLTDTQRDRMASFAQSWIEYGWRTTPLTDEEWTVWEAGARKCYEFAGKPWPGIVIRVPNPMVGAFAAPFAAIAIELHRQLPPAITKALATVDLPEDSSAVDSAVGSAVDSAVYSAVGSAVDSAVGSSRRRSAGRRPPRASWAPRSSTARGRPLRVRTSRAASSRSASGRRA